ncbi:MAG: general secretion pathway protein GspD [Planctomycetia bacterium]|nr:general secretion pathway protein GspD [Planctomycetia bacterium]
MNTSKSFPVIAVLMLAPLTPSVATAAGHQSVHLWLMTGALGGAKSKKVIDREEADGLLARARQAIKEGDFDAADALITRAEKMKVEYSVFHLGDTPKKARSQLNAARRSGKPASVERPSKKFTPEMPADNATEARPQASVDASGPHSAPQVPSEVLDPDQEAPLELPQGEGLLPLSPVAQRIVGSPDEESREATRIPDPVHEHPVSAEASPEARRESDAQLLAARRALAVGDVRRAIASVDAARKMNVSYGYHDDTPDKVEIAIRNYRQVTEAATGRQASEASRHQMADLLMDQAQQLMRWKDYDEAERLARHVQGLRVNYGPFEVRPEGLLEKIAAARKQNTRGVPSTADDGRTAQAGPPRAQAPGVVPAGGAVPKMPAYPTTKAVYDPGHDVTRNLISSGQEEDVSVGDGDDSQSSVPVEKLPLPNQAPRPVAENGSSGMQLFQQGAEALRNRDLPKALELFRQAYALRDQLDAKTAQRLQDHLQLLSAPAGGPRGSTKPESLIDNAAAKQQLLFKQTSAEVAQKEIAATKIREKDPKRAVEILKEARAGVEAAGLDPEARAQLLRRIDRKVAELDKYINDNRAQIELDSANKDVLKEVDRRRQGKIEVDDKLAKLVDEFNKLMDQQRYAEAEVLAKRAREMDPENPVVKQLIWQNRFVSRQRRNQNLLETKEKMVVESLDSVEQSAIPFDDREPYKMPDAKTWEELTKTRSKRLAENRSRRTERELEIERKLKTPVSLKFRNRPLSEVIEQLSKLAAVNIYLDPKGLDEEGISSDTPVTIDLTSDISLKSALNLILEPYHLSYIIADEVLKITSEQLRDGHVYQQTYSVADLVIPIPNFPPNGRIGLAGALSDAYSVSGNGVGGMGGQGATAFLASQDGTQASGIMNPKVLAQMNQLAPGNLGSRSASGVNQSVPFGPGGVGGGAQADFDSLIELITTTVKPQTWDEVGGPGSISEFRNNLSLVISQTQEVHEDIVDLLEQLRRNQDLQVTIEVRFITLNDNFFERIGVDFQFNIDNRNPPNNPPIPGQNNKEIVGLQTVGGNAPSGDAPSFTSALDIPFRQSSFNLATPQFGQPVEVAHFGFAILSDLEAYFLVNAAQGDRRSNVLQAPKVTLFNGQQASVSDVTQTPFVISVIPVVGDFAAAYQPVITVLSEGTFLTVQAVISNDRRFVRLTVVPFFSNIGDVKEFTFSGSKTTTNKSSASDTKGGGGSESKSSTGEGITSTDGITIQLPNFSFVSVNTTVSVPDGGTVLLGGIKRLSEGRNEFGVPILSKLPYINRLFKNVGIGRETQSLMMMVTPRIIIQEEEEERLGIQAPP